MPWGSAKVVEEDWEEEALMVEEGDALRRSCEALRIDGEEEKAGYDEDDNENGNFCGCLELGLKVEESRLCSLRERAMTREGKRAERTKVKYLEDWLMISLRSVSSHRLCTSDQSH